MCGHKKRRGGRGRRQWGGGYRRPKHNIPVNIIELDDRFEAYIFAVGFDKKDIRITVSNDVLYMSGQRTPEDEFPNFLLQEYPIKSFERWFELSEKADQAKITARQENGILMITVPKTAAATQPDVEVDIV